VARVFVSGPWCLDDLVDRGGKLFGRRWRWLRPLAQRVLAEFDSGPRPPARRVAAFLIGDDKFHHAWEKDGPGTSGGRWLRPVMSPVPGAPSGWGVPAILTPGALADRLGLTLEQLEWFAGRWRRGSRPGSGPLRHYRYQWRTKRSSSPRLIESPKPKLKAIQ